MIWYLVLFVIVLAIAYVAFNYAKIKAMKEGTEEMAEMAGIIREGAATFMKTEYKTILIVVAILLVAFTITMIILFNRTGMIPDTLCTCVFACLGGECGAMAWIKTTKDRFREREWEQEDKKEQLKEDETHEP